MEASGLHCGLIKELVLLLRALHLQQYHGHL